MNENIVDTIVNRIELLAIELEAINSELVNLEKAKDLLTGHTNGVNPAKPKQGPRKPPKQAGKRGPKKAALREPFKAAMEGIGAGKTRRPALIEYMAKRLGCSPGSASQHIVKAKKAGWIKSAGRGSYALA